VASDTIAAVASRACVPLSPSDVALFLPPRAQTGKER